MWNGCYYTNGMSPITKAMWCFSNGLQDIFLTCQQLNRQVMHRCVCATVSLYCTMSDHCNRLIVLHIFLHSRAYINPNYRLVWALRVTCQKSSLCAPPLQTTQKIMVRSLVVLLVVLWSLWSLQSLWLLWPLCAAVGVTVSNVSNLSHVCSPNQPFKPLFIHNTIFKSLYLSVCIPYVNA